jgi:hypothetical protein
MTPHVPFFWVTLLLGCLLLFSIGLAFCMHKIADLSSRVTLLEAHMQRLPRSVFQWLRDEP